MDLLFIVIRTKAAYVGRVFTKVCKPNRSSPGLLLTFCHLLLSPYPLPAPKLASLLLFDMVQ